MNEQNHREVIPWGIRMERLIERLAKHCTGCPYRGSLCAHCDSATAVGILRDRDSYASCRGSKPAKPAMKAYDRRANVASNMSGRGWMKPADIAWPRETPANVRTMDLARLVADGIVERRQPDSGNERVFLYRRVEK